MAQDIERGGFDLELAELRRRIEELRDDPSVDPALLEEQHDALERLFQAHQSERGQHQQLVSALPTPVLVTDTDGVIDTANSATAGLLHIDASDLVRRPLADFVHDSDRPELRRLLGSVLAEDGSPSSVVTLMPPDGEPVSVQAMVSMTQSAMGRPASVTWLLLAGAREGATGQLPDELALARAFSEISQIPLHTSEPADVLRRVAAICGRALGPEVSVSVSVGAPANPEHLASESKLAQTIDGAQMLVDEGPCQSAWETRVSVRTDDLRSDGRWPRLAGNIADADVGGAVAVPVMVDDQVVGSLNVYASVPGTFSDEQLHVAEQLGVTVAAVLHQLDEKIALTALAAQLRTALESRAVIDQAKGIVMARERCDADEAFRILAKMSSDQNVKLRELAQQMVDEVSGT